MYKNALNLVSASFFFSIKVQNKLFKFSILKYLSMRTKSILHRVIKISLILYFFLKYQPQTKVKTFWRSELFHSFLTGRIIWLNSIQKQTFRLETIQPIQFINKLNRTNLLFINNVSFLYKFSLPLF